MEIFSPHALERIAQRFDGVDMGNKFELSSRVGKKTRQKIKAACPVSAEKWMRDGFQGRYYRITKDKIVFMVEPPERIVTVFRLAID